MLKLARRMIPALALALLPFMAFAGDDENPSFVRFVEKGGNKGSLDVAWARYRSEKTKVEVVLYGVVHIADADYYKQVQKDLNSYEGVLYEGVKPSETAEPDENMKAIGEMQGLMGEMMGLTFQKDGIDYTQKNLIHADMTFDELQKASGGDLSKTNPMFKMIDPKMIKQLKPLMGMMKGMGKGMMRNNPLGDGMKMMMARQLGNSNLENMPGAEEMMRVILIERNKVCFNVLDKELAKRDSGTLAIFYGAAHMPDMEKRLAERGFKQVEKKWLTAWQIGGKKKVADDSDEDEDEPKTKEKAEPKKPVLTPGKRWL